MTAIDVLKALRQRGVTLVPDGEELRYRAPKGVLTDEFCVVMRGCKAALLALLICLFVGQSKDRIGEPFFETWIVAELLE